MQTGYKIYIYTEQYFTISYFKLLQNHTLLNDVIFLIDLLRTEYTLLYSVQVYKKDDIIHGQPQAP